MFDPHHTVLQKKIININLAQIVSKIGFIASGMVVVHKRI